LALDNLRKAAGFAKQARECFHWALKDDGSGAGPHLGAGCQPAGGRAHGSGDGLCGSALDGTSPFAKGAGSARDAAGQTQNALFTDTSVAEQARSAAQAAQARAAQARARLELLRRAGVGGEDPEQRLEQARRMEHHCTTVRPAAPRPPAAPPAPPLVRARRSLHVLPLVVALGIAS
jgi:hypothetical protein